ncbi:hypothetical protein LCGC14_0401440 [marine sediment metagenome]|uniref:Portal protein n=1 Tax=marine sediment metagenome TaxID=412755 RepID=A0A0F9VIK4_9ZZZZ
MAESNGTTDGGQATFGGRRANVETAHGMREARSGDGRRADKLVDARHPEWTAAHGDWEKWRLTYEGGREYMDAFLIEYSRRERVEDFEVRKELSYNPNFAGSNIDIVRNAIMVKMPDVVRSGSAEYEEIVQRDVDMSRSSMGTFIGLEVVALLLSQGRRYMGVDAPIAQSAAPGRPVTKAEERDRGPYVWAIDAEDVLSWALDDEGRFVSVLIRETVDVFDPEIGMATGTRQQFRVMWMVDEEFEREVALADGEVETLRGPGVLVRVLNQDDEDVVQPQVLPLSRIPIVRFELVDSLMKDMAEMQQAILNLASTDMSFLFRGNFPIYTEQFDHTKSALKPRGSKRQVQSNDEIVSERDRLIDEDDRKNVREAGAGSRGVGYGKDLERPGFIAPTTENLKGSMDKQDKLAQDMRALLDLGMVSISVRAAEQSGKSKEADRVGVEAFLAYLCSVLEAGEENAAVIFHEFLGQPNQASQVKYPQGHTLKTRGERRAEAKELRDLSTAVRSPTYQKALHKRLVDVLLRSELDPTQLAAIENEIEDSVYFDDDKERSELIQKDVAAKILSKATAAKLRGYDDIESTRASLEMELEIEAMAGGVGDTEVPDDLDVPPDDDDSTGGDGDG